MVHPGRRPPGRPRHGDPTIPTQDQILRAAGELFMRLGYRRVTMEMVASAAGITKAAVYYHFADKPSLVVEATTGVFHRVAARTEALLGRPAPLYDRLVAVAEIVLSLPDPFISFEALLRDARDDLTPAQVAQIRTAEEAIGDLVVGAVTAAVRGGELAANTNGLLVAHGYLALMRLGQTRDAQGRPRFPDAAGTARALVDMLWHGVAGATSPP